MKNIKKFSLLLITMISIVLLVACSKTETIIYETEQGGSFIRVSIDYDKDKNVVKSLQEINMNFEGLELTEDQIKAFVDEGEEQYKDKKGIEYKAETKKTEVKMTVTYTIKDMSEEDKKEFFGNIIDDKGNIKADKWEEQLEKSGMKKIEK